jgi:hypothetical protein
MLKKIVWIVKNAPKKLEMNEKHKGGIVFNRDLLHLKSWHYKLYW